MTGAISQLTSVLGRSSDLTEVFRTAVAGLRSTLGADLVGIASLGERAENLVIEDAAGLPPEFVQALSSLPILHSPLFRRVMDDKLPVCLPVAQHPGPQRAVFESAGIRHLAMAPLLSRGLVLGALGVGRRAERPFQKAELDVLGTIGGLVGLALGETAAYREAETRAQTQAELRLSHERLELLARATSDALWDWDAASDRVWRGPAIETLFGHSPAEAGDSPDWWADHLHPEDRERVLALRDRIRQSGTNSWFAEYRFRRKDGSYSVVRDRAHVTRDASGRAVRMTGSMMDVTRERAAQEALRAAREELERRVIERTSELVAANTSLQHEIAERERVEHALREQVRLASFAAGIGAALTGADDLDEALHRCTEAMVRHLDAGLAHIWIVEPGNETPVLRASAGLAIEGELRPCHAISAIAQARRAHVTQSILHDPLTRDAHWATKRGLVAFAGYPLSVEDQVLGVMALLSPRPFPEATLNALSGVASQLALGLTRKIAADALRTTHADLGRRVQERTAALLEEIAERKRAEDDLRGSREQLRQLAAKLERVREEERTRIAREIHDELGQALTAVKLDVSSLKRLYQRKGSRRTVKPTHQDAIQERLQTMAGLVDQTVQIVRRISTELRPAVLDSLGLAAAIEWLAQDFERRTDIRCVFRSTLDEEAIPREVATAAFRILQETLTNVVRHAEAGWVAVNLGLDDKALLALDITDDGKGISKEALGSPKSIGLAGMRERALLLGGNVQVEGRPGQGTSVRVRLPVSRHKEGGTQ
ncbi:MAG TPA: GAF domain-containing protein [Vicinamibacteria bacterium]|nr:GAF domain-containing protein [Vicinamibacteria bacterium]